MGITAGPTRLEFFGGEDTDPKSITVTVSGDTAGTLTLSLVDAVIDATGGWQDAPFGSTPTSLDGAATISPITFDYVPTGSPQNFTAYIQVDAEQITAPRLGSVIVALEPDLEGDTAPIGQAGAVALQVVAAPTPEAIAGLSTTEVSVTLTDLALQPTGRWTAIDDLFPDLPWIVNHCPATVVATGRNSGTVFLDQRVTYVFERRNPIQLFAGGATPVYTASNVPRYLLPGQEYVDSLSSEVPLTGGGRVDALPFIGFVRVTATATGSIAGLEAEPVSRTITFLVFPWKEATFLFLVWLFQREWRHRKGRKVHAGDGPPPRTLRARIKDRIDPPKSV